jgi:UDP-glucose 4-epimerase
VYSTGYRVVSLRYFNPIGAHPSTLIGEMPLGVPNNLVPFITQTAAGIREKLTVFGSDYNTPDGSCLRDYIHIVDLAKAHVKALMFLEKQPSGKLCEAFNLGTGVGASVLELIQKFMKVTGVNLPYTIGPRRSGDIEKVYADPKKANTKLDWKTSFSMEDALLHSWQWQQKLPR